MSETTFNLSQHTVGLSRSRVDVVLEEDAQEHSIELAPGQALVVPRGVWHRVLLREPSQLLHITPGPGG